MINYGKSSEIINVTMLYCNAFPRCSTRLPLIEFGPRFSVVNVCENNAGIVV